MSALLKAASSPVVGSWARATVGSGAGLSRATRLTSRAAAMPAQAATTEESTHHGGTVYPVPSTGVMKYANVDGGRFNDGRYTAFKSDIMKSLIPEERVYTDPVKTFAYGRGLFIVRTIFLLILFHFFRSSSACRVHQPRHTWRTCDDSACARTRARHMMD